VLGGRAERRRVWRLLPRHGSTTQPWILWHFRGGGKLLRFASGPRWHCGDSGDATIPSHMGAMTIRMANLGVLMSSMRGGHLLPPRCRSCASVQL